MSESGQPTSFVPVAFYNTNGWKVVATADLNNDAVTDLVLQHGNSNVAGWLMNHSGQPEMFVWIASYNLNGWKVAGTTDVDNDGIDDIVLQHENSWVGAWLLNASGQPTAFVPINFYDTGGWRVNGRNAGTVTPGTYSGLFGFPSTFLTGSALTEAQVLRAIDSQYLSLRKMHGGVAPYSFCRVEYDPPAYGHTLPNGIALGDTAFPSGNSGHHRWEVMAHEQGHNFFGGTSSWYSTLAVPGPFLQESFAVLSAFYTFNDLIENQVGYGLDGQSVSSLQFAFANERNYQEARFNLYQSRGAPFDQEDVLTSQALDFKMIQYGERLGWANYVRFARAFRPEIQSRFQFHMDGVTATERSTYVIAALGVAFGQDFRSEFAALQFPIDDALYETLAREIRAF